MPAKKKHGLPDPFLFLKNGAAPFFTRHLRHLALAIYFYMGRRLRRFFCLKQQSVAHMCVQIAFGEYVVSAKRGRDLWHGHPDPPRRDHNWWQESACKAQWARTSSVQSGGAICDMAPPTPQRACTDAPWGRVGRKARCSKLTGAIRGLAPRGLGELPGPKFPLSSLLSVFSNSRAY